MQAAIGYQHATAAADARIAAALESALRAEDDQADEDGDEGASSVAAPTG